MSGWTAVVPIKPAGDRKSRLNSHLTPAARIAMTETMLAHVLAILVRSPAIAEVAVLARQKPPGWGGGWFPDGGTGLNDELGVIAGLVARRFVVLHADMPALTAADVDALVSAAEGGSAIAPDRHRRGTNAIALDAASGTRFAFGVDSFRHHRAMLPIARTVERPGLMLDIDDPADLAEAIRLGVLGPCGQRSA